MRQEIKEVEYILEIESITIKIEEKELMKLGNVNLGRIVFNF